MIGSTFLDLFVLTTERVESMILRVMCAVYLVAGLASALADEGRPVAVRWWGQGMVSIESFWNLQVVVDPYAKNLGGEKQPVTADVVLLTHADLTPKNTRAIQGKPTIVQCPTGTGNNRGGLETLYHSLGRVPNQARPTWLFHGKATQSIRDRSPIHVDGIPGWRDDSEGDQSGATSMLAIETDGVRIVHCGDLGQAELTGSQVKQMGQVDVLIIKADTATAPKLIAQVRPRYVLPIAYRTKELSVPAEVLKAFLAALGKKYEIDRPKGNTFAVSSADSDDEMSTRIVLPRYEPFKPQGELATLMQKMETAGTRSQKVFAALSAEQLSWQPPNGSHTPRWNAEHMMGRQLGFFSQIYAALDPELTAINLNPKQMPEDYRPAHPKWDGKEEARQMERSAAFVRRFAYLLDGIDLDKRAPGSRWTPRGLLEQMVRHFNSHTANVRKKFALEGWPGSSQ